MDDLQYCLQWCHRLHGTKLLVLNLVINGWPSIHNEEIADKIPLIMF